MAIILTDKFTKAVNMSITYHGNKMRKGSDIPYMSHLFAVASIVMENGEHENEVIAALLHDAAEDAGGRDTLEEIRQCFGNEVAEIVDHCSDTLEKKDVSSYTPEERKAEFYTRKEKYIKRLVNTIQNPSSHLVSLADKIHNSRAILNDYRRIEGRLWERFSGGEEGTRWYYRELIKAYKKIINDKQKKLLEELERNISELESLINAKQKK